jgi:hypothetical protein
MGTDQGGLLWKEEEKENMRIDFIALLLSKCLQLFGNEFARF